MIDLMHQIVDIAKNIAHIFNMGIVDPLTMIVKSIGTLFVKVLELSLMMAKWVIGKI